MNDKDLERLMADITTINKRMAKAASDLNDIKVNQGAAHAERLHMAQDIKSLCADVAKIERVLYGNGHPDGGLVGLVRSHEEKIDQNTDQIKGIRSLGVAVILIFIAQVVANLLGLI